MPVFHTKTIESILDPVAQQVRELKKVRYTSEGKYNFLFFFVRQSDKSAPFSVPLILQQKGEGGEPLATPS